MTEQQTKYLEDLIKAFALNKLEADDLKKVCDSQNAEIKGIMSNEGLDKWETDDYTANYIVKQGTVVDEDRLFLVLKETWIEKYGSMECPFIKKIEVIDDKALEDAIYSGKLDEDFLQKIKECSTPKLTPTLTVKKKGKKK